MRSLAIRTAQVVFAVIMTGFGVYGLIKGAFTPIWAGVPKTMAGRTALAYGCAAVSLVSGGGLLLRRTAKSASLLLLWFLYLWFVFVRVPAIVRAPAARGPWWVAGETAVLIAVAWVLYICFAGRAAEGRGLRVAYAFYGAGLIPFGVAHFTYLQRTVSMVPSWLPWHLLWAYLTGCTFIMAGVAIALGICPRLATVLTAWQIGLFTLLVWGPVAVSGPTPADWQEIVVSCLLTAAAGVLTTPYRSVPWLALRPSLPIETAPAEAKLAV